MTAVLGLAPAAAADPWNQDTSSTFTGNTLVGVDCISGTQCEAAGWKPDGNLADPVALGESAGTWSSQITGQFEAQLSGVKCLSGTDCVAVGYSFQDVNQFVYRHSLVETWDGTQWTQYGVNLDQDSDYNLPHGIACTSSAQQNECIAVGNSKGSSGGFRNLILRGTQPSGGGAWTWEVLSGVPSPGMTNSTLTAVSCPAAGQCIAVGSAQTFFQNSGNFNGAEELEGTESSNGTWTWTTLGTDNTGGALSGVACTSTTSCLAVGSIQGSPPTQPLVETWNGSGGFTAVDDPPAPGGWDNELDGISCETASNCTVVGYYDDQSGDPWVPLVEQWDGTSWHQVQAPSSGAGFARLTSVACDAASNQCTAVGSDNGNALVDTGSGYVPGHTLTLSPSGSGSGTVTDNTGAISCPSTCSHAYPAGATVTLTATPAPGSAFAGWSGGGCSGTGTCTVTMSADTSVTAAFSQSPSTSGSQSQQQPAPIAPVVSGGAPTSKTSKGASVAGTVNPEGVPTTAHFEYGLDLSQRGPGADTTLYDQQTAPQQVGSDVSDHTVTDTLTGLIPGARYHVRLVATNSAGTTPGLDQTFTTAPAAAPLPPVLGKSQDVKPVSGIVFIKTPGGQFIPLTSATQIPNGSVIDALHGSLQILAALAKHKTEQGIFGGAIFKLTQTHSGLSTLALVEGAFKGAPTYATCKAPHKAADATAAALSSKTLQLLHASAHGKFRTKGRYSAATVRGTNWTIADRCDGTLTRDITHSIAVTDFVRHKTIILHAGQSYLAKARRG